MNPRAQQKKPPCGGFFFPNPAMDYLAADASEAGAMGAAASDAGAAGVTTTAAGSGAGTTTGAGVTTVVSSFLPQATSAAEAIRAANTRDLFILIYLKNMEETKNRMPDCLWLPTRKKRECLCSPSFKLYEEKLIRYGKTLISRKSKVCVNLPLYGGDNVQQILTQVPPSRLRIATTPGSTPETRGCFCAEARPALRASAVCDRAPP